MMLASTAPARLVRAIVVSCVLAVGLAAPAPAAVQFESAWGFQGSGPGAFQFPRGIAVGPDGELYVADQLNHRVQVFTPGGTYLRQIGSAATLQHPFHLAVSPAGILYVSDIGNNRVSRFELDGSYLGFFNGSGLPGAPSFFQPRGLAFAPGGDVYVLDSGNNRIGRFTPSGQAVSAIGAQGFGDGEFETPFGLASDGDGNLYVNDAAYNYRIQVLDRFGTFVRKWGEFGAGPGQFDFAAGIAVDADRTVWVADHGNNRVQWFSATGTFLGQFGTPGSGPGQFQFPYELAVAPSGTLYVADSFNHRVQRFDTGMTPSDTTDPFVNLSPADGATFAPGEVVNVSYSCGDETGGSGVRFCIGDRPDGATLDTSTVGQGTVEVRAIDRAGNERVVTHTYTVAVPNPDQDGDGIPDALDGDPQNASQDFADGSGTSGTILDRGGLDVTVSDLADPDGIRIVTGPGSSTQRVRVRVCGFTVQIAAGSEIELTCGSVTVRTVEGSAEVLLAEGASSVVVPAGAKARISDAGGGSFTIQNQGSVPVTATIDGIATTIAGGASSVARTWHFVGFEAPVNALPVVNTGTAGRTYPLKWRLLKADGTPVTDLQTATVRLASMACAADAPTDAIEETATGSGLKNLGDGYYSYNWVTSKSHAGSCWRLKLDLGEGITRDALFKFKG